MYPHPHAHSLLTHSYSFVCRLFFFFFNDTATTEIYTLSLHDALPIWCDCPTAHWWTDGRGGSPPYRDRKSTRLNSSHLVISYAVFCLKKKKQNKNSTEHPILHARARVTIESDVER